MKLKLSRKKGIGNIDDSEKSLNKSRSSGDPKRNPNHLPVLIIPGIMSSGLEVRKSAVDKRYIGERVWLNPIAAGAGKVRRGKAFTTNRCGSSKTTLGGDDDSTSQSPMMKSSTRGRARWDGRPSMREFAGFRKKDSNRGTVETDASSDYYEWKSPKGESKKNEGSSGFSLPKFKIGSCDFKLPGSHDFKSKPGRKTFAINFKGQGGEKRRSIVRKRDSKKADRRPSIIQHLGFRKADSDDESDFSEFSFSEYGLLRSKELDGLDCKSTWLQHMSLTSDMCTEREGNEIRPIPGLKGVNFLTDIANIKVGASYVFAPVIKLLRINGYVKGVNLDACPYDWRVPPSILEERDGYFTKTMERIERMVAECDGKPVVLLCHSMGGKCGHYLLNFVIETLGPVDGRAWLDKHIHTYMPLGAAHIGAPSILASTFSAELNPVLDSLVTMQERLVFSRSLGSACWLMPTTLPSLERNAPPAIICKKEGKLTIRIDVSKDEPLGDLRDLVTNSHGSREVNPFKIKVDYGHLNQIGETVVKGRSGESIPVDDPIPKRNKPNAQYFDLPCAQFVFPTKASLLGDDDDDDDDDDDLFPIKPIRFTIMERGDIKSYRLEPKSLCMSMLYNFSPGHRRAIIGNSIAKKAGKYKTKLAQSSTIDCIDIKKLVRAGQKGITMRVPMTACADRFFPRHRSIIMKINIKWEGPPSNADDDLNNPIAMYPSVEDNDHKKKKKKKKKQKRKGEKKGSAPAPFAPIPEVVSTMDDYSKYIPLSGQAMLRAEGLEDSFVALARDRYSPELDHVGPRHKSSYDRPPVKRIFAIYGTNLETAVSKVCKRVPFYHEDKTAEGRLARPRFQVDTDACLRDPSGISASGHTLENGTLYEHAGTPQVDLRTGETVNRSGDGTVPYYCLQQSSVWAREVENDPDTADRVRIEEIEGAEHRGIIADQRFHKLLLDYVTGRTQV